MAQWTQDDVRELLEEKLTRGIARMKAKGQRPSVSDLAGLLSPFVLALMSDARRREVGRAQKAAEHKQPLNGYLGERHRELKIQARAVWNLAEEIEKEREHWR